MLALCLLALVSYAGGLRNGFLYDDHEVILAQPAPRSVADLARVFQEPHFRGLPYYRPVVRATLLLQKTLHGDLAPAFHALNLALAAAAGVVAYGILRRPGFAVGAPQALLAAGFLVAHPIASSCVYPAASGRETLLPALLGLCAFSAHLRRGARWRALSLAAFAGALFGKEASVVLPPLFVLADALRLSEDPPGRSARRWLLRYGGYLPLLAAYFAVRRTLFSGGEWQLAVLQDPFGPLLALLYGVQTVFAPTLDLVYEPDTGVWWSPARLALAMAAATALAAAVWRAGPAARRAGVFWSAWFVLAQLPTAHLLEQEAPYDERYVYLAALAPFAVAGAALSAPGLSQRLRGAGMVAAALLLAAALGTSARRAIFFHDDQIFAAQWVRTNPASPEAHLTLGLARSRVGDLEGAAAFYRAALRLQPDLASAHVNLGAALVTLGRLEEARAHFERAVALSPENPEAHNNLGLVLAAAGRYGEALVHYDAALRSDARFVEAWNNRGTALARSGDLAGAEASLRQALRLAPGYEDAQRNLSLVLERRAEGQGAPR